MGIKSLTQTIKKNAPDAIHNDNLYKLSGKKVAVDASLIIYRISVFSLLINIYYIPINDLTCQFYIA